MRNQTRLGRAYRRDTELMVKVDGIWVRKLTEKELQRFTAAVQSDAPSHGRQIMLRDKAR